jgi:lysophospholipase L1-like esterase
MPALRSPRLSPTSTSGRIAFGAVVIAVLVTVAPTVVRAAAKPAPVIAGASAPSPAADPAAGSGTADPADTGPAAGSGAGAVQPQKGAYVGEPSATKVALVGDSLLFAAGWWTTHDLTERGYQAWTNGVIGHTGADRLPKLRQMLASEPDILVIELGTNDAGRASREVTQARQDEALASEMASTRTALDLVRHVPCVVWVTPSSHVLVAPEAVGGAEMHNRLAAKYTAAVNDEVERNHPNVIVADWSTWSASHPEWFDADGIHSNAVQAGQRGMADLITSTVEQCPKR